MNRAVATALIGILSAVSGTAAAAPTVRLETSDCTTEPAPTAPQVRVLHSTQRGALRVRVVGAGRYCAAGWTATVDATGAVTLTADDSVDAPACPTTCAITLRVAHLPPLRRGHHRTVTIRG